MGIRLEIEWKDIIILANSFKHGKRCLAGKDIKTGKWLRLGISNRNDPTQFDESDLLKFTGEQYGPNVLDVYKIPLKSSMGSCHHPEDWIVDGQPWQFLRKGNIGNLFSILDPPPYELLNRSSYYSDSIQASDLICNPLGASLHLIRITPSNEAKILYSPYSSSSKWSGFFKPRLTFKYDAIRYNFSITDPTYPRMPTQPPERNFSSGFLAIGLSQEFQSSENHEMYHYKLALTLLSLDIGKGA